MKGKIKKSTSGERESNSKQNNITGTLKKKYIPDCLTRTILGVILKWTREELKRMDQTTIKLMAMHKALHSRNNVDRLYVSRKEGGKAFASTEYSVDASILLKDYREKYTGILLTAIRNNNDDTGINRTKISRKQKWEEKQLYRRFKK